MTVKELMEKCSFESVVMPNPQREVTGGYVGDLLSWVMGRATEGCAWITIMSNVNTIAVASLIDMSTIILAEDVKLSDELIETAKEKGINVLSSKEASYETAVMISQFIN